MNRRRKGDIMTDASWPRRCTTTRESLILAAQHGGEEGRGALSEIYRRYFFPVLALLAAPHRRASAPAELAHAFFAERLVLRGDLAKYDKTKATRFRYWLFTAAHHFFLNHLAYERRPRRDCRLTMGYDPELHDVRGQTGTEHAAARQEAHRLLLEVVSELRAEYCASSSSDHDGALRSFEAFKPFLVMKMTDAQCTAVARDLGVTPNTAKVRLSRLREKFAKRFRSSVIVQYGFDDLQACLNAWCAATLEEPPKPAA
jgi:DNA-directed RNA polymerase specialized sigma24 family protein